MNSMKTSTGLSRLEINCGRPATHRPLFEELFALSPPVLPASAHEIEEFMNAADEKRQLHQVMRARKRLNASLRAQVSGRPPALRNEVSFLYWRTKCRAFPDDFTSVKETSYHTPTLNRLGANARPQRIQLIQPSSAKFSQVCGVEESSHFHP
jgi:hypothetical protein